MRFSSSGAWGYAASSAATASLGPREVAHRPEQDHVLAILGVGAVELHHEDDLGVWSADDETLLLEDHCAVLE